MLEAIEAGSALSASSLDATDRDPSGESTTVLERLGEDDSRFAIAEELASISPSLRELPQRDRLILYLRFAEDRTQSEIASEVGISQMHVSRLLRRTLERLRGHNEPAGSAL